MVDKGLSYVCRSLHRDSLQNNDSYILVIMTLPDKRDMKDGVSSVTFPHLTFLVFLLKP